MKVAILGAGVSGLSCAFELEKHGITPVIFEKNHAVGEELGYTGLWLRLMIRMQGDPVEYMERCYGLKLCPLGPLEQTVMISPTKRTMSSGYQGYLFRRGLEANSLENQIASQVKTAIQFNTFAELQSIQKEFTHIVVATSKPYIPRMLGVWTDTFLSQTRVTTVVGEFTMDSATIWFNEDYSSKGFCYLIPNSPKEATLALIVNNATVKELDFYWDNFMAGEGVSYHILKKSDAEHVCGRVWPCVVDNIYFVGNSGGFTDDLIGVGSLNAIESGIFAARSIALGADYSELVRPMIEDVAKLHELRKLVNTFSNEDFDRLITFLGLPGIKQMVYGTSFLKASQLSPVVQRWNEFSGKS